MLSPYTPPQDDPAEIAQPHRGVIWVAQAAFALLAIAAWLFLMFHVLLIVRAEYKLRDMLEEAKVFSELPQVSHRELASFVQTRTDEAGWSDAAITIAPNTWKQGAWQVAAIRVPAEQVVPPRLHSIVKRLGASQSVVVQTGQNDAKRLF